MKTIIIYASTYGFTKDCVDKLAKQLKDEIVCINIMSEKVPELDDFDYVLIGGSIYMGQIQKKIKEFCAAHLEELSHRRVGLFLSCGLLDNLELHMKNSFPETLLKNAISKECFGGELRMDKMKMVHKLLTNVMKKAAEKEGKPPVAALHQNITKLATLINNA